MCEIQIRAVDIYLRCVYKKLLCKTRRLAYLKAVYLQIGIKKCSYRCKEIKTDRRDILEEKNHIKLPSTCCRETQDTLLGNPVLKNVSATKQNNS